jgi:hypothetical protein
MPHASLYFGVSSNKLKIVRLTDMRFGWLYDKLR